MDTIHFVPIALKERDCYEETDLHGVELRTVVALLAAVSAGRPGLTRNQIVACTGVAASLKMRALERRRWVVPIGKRGNTMVYAPSPSAAQRLELCGWKVLLFYSDELDRVDPNLPGFLPHSDARLRSAVVDTVGEAEAERRSA